MTNTATQPIKRHRLTYCRALPASPSPPTAPRRTVLLGDASQQLATLPDDSVDCVITSPPYFLLRNYQVAGQLGQEATVDQWVDNLVAVCDQLARVLKPTGSLWLNVGDSYSRRGRLGAPPKSLLLGPERLLLRLAEHGWIVRNRLVWHKPSPLPASVRDRFNNTWEPIYLLVRSARYHFDLDAVRIPHVSKPRPRPVRPAKYQGQPATWAGPLAGAQDGLDRAKAEGRAGHRLGKNPGDVLTVGTAGYRGAHFATFPTRLIQRPMLAGCPARTCSACGVPWKSSDGELTATCSCNAAWQAGLVLDPFFGAGTVGLVAEQHGRDWLGIELNPSFKQLAEERITAARSAR